MIRNVGRKPRMVCIKSLAGTYSSAGCVDKEGNAMGGRVVCVHADLSEIIGVDIFRVLVHLLGCSWHSAVKCVPLRQTRFLWHDRIHAKAMYRMAVKTFGENCLKNPFGFSSAQRRKMCSAAADSSHPYPAQSCTGHKNPLRISAPAASAADILPLQNLWRELLEKSFWLLQPLTLYTKYQLFLCAKTQDGLHKIPGPPERCAPAHPGKGMIRNVGRRL